MPETYPRGTETLSNKTLTETVQIPGLEGFIHVETDPPKLAASFGEFSEYFGHGKEEALRFFEQHVGVRFGPIRDLDQSRGPHYSEGLPRAFGKFLTLSEGPLGEVILAKEDLLLGIDVNRVVKALPGLKAGGFEGSSYGRMTAEEKQAAFRNFLNSIIYHEFRHVIQYMEDPERLKAHLEQRKFQEKALLIVLGTSIGTYGMYPGEGVGGVLAGTGMLLTSVYGIKKYSEQRWGIDDIEEEPRQAQKQLSSMHLVKSPVNYIYESS